MSEGCVAQTYWYENGLQCAGFCPRTATRVTRALDGSRNRFCDEHADLAVAAGAEEVSA